jgi:hypothetical protein
MLGDADTAARTLAERDTGPAFGFRGPEQQLATPGPPTRQLGTVEWRS